MDGDSEKRDVRRPMNAFLIFCKRHRSMVREKNPDLDNRSVTRILGDLWANLKEDEKCVYTDLAKQYKDAFMKANPDYKWHNPDKTPPSQKLIPPKPTNMKVIKTEMDLLPEGSIIPGKLADPSNMGGLSLLLMAGQQNGGTRQPNQQVQIADNRDQVAGTNIDAGIDMKNKGSVSECQISANQKAVEEAVNRRLCESAIKYGERQTEKGSYSKTTDQNVSNYRQTDDVSETDHKIEKKSNELSDKGGPPYQYADQPFSKVDTNDGVKLEKESKASTKQDLLQLAEMCSNVVSHRRSLSPLHGLQSSEIRYGEKSKEDLGKPRTPVYKGILAEALLDTCSKGNYPSLIKGDNFGVSCHTENAAVKAIPGLETVRSENNVNSTKSDEVENKDSKNYVILRTSVPEKSEISRILVADVKKDDKKDDEESAMVTCGKMVVNHIIDKLYFSDLATAARKTAYGKQEQDEIKLELSRHENALLSSKSHGETSTYDLPDTTKKKACKESENDRAKGASAIGINGNFDEHDGSKSQGQTKTVPAPPIKADKYVSKSLKDKILSRVMKEQSLEMLDNKVDIKEESENKTNVAEVSPPAQSEMENKTVPNEPQTASRKRTVSQNSNSGIDDNEADDRDEFHPVRKSKRRNRGQRYQELINEGIIQPSKERMAAIMHDSKNESGEMEEFQSIDSHILPETAIRRIRKRTISESDKGRVMSPEEAKRYKTGDFDLEAHIATLPACCIENLGRKRGFARQRHFSETCPNRKQEDLEETDVVLDMEKTVSLPPHIKIPSPERTKEPVRGSRKRKARKHSINHLLPAPAPPPVSNTQTKSPKDLHLFKEQSASSHHSDLSELDTVPDGFQQKQTVSSDVDQSKCSECAKAENHSSIVQNTVSCGKLEVLGSLTTELPLTDSGMNVYANSENESKHNVSFTKHYGKIEGKYDHVQLPSLSGQGGEGEVVPVSSNDGSTCSNREGDSVFWCDTVRLPCDIGDTFVKPVNNSDQCKTECQSVLHGDDSDRMAAETGRPDVMKCSDLLKEGGILYTDDLVLEEKAAGRSEISEQFNNISENNTDRVVGKNLIEQYSEKREIKGQCQDLYLQNKENVIHTEGLKSVDDRDVAIKIDLVHAEKQLSNEMLRKTLEQGQVTPDSVSLYVIAENRGCDKIPSAVTGAETKDVNFNSKVQSQLN